MPRRSVVLRSFCLVALAAALAGCAGAAPPAAPAPRPGPALRSVVLMLDGVPYPVMDSLVRAGHFRGFAPPARMVSPFPSLTGVAFRDIWREPLSPGYEDLYFDPERNELRGGALDHFFGGDAEPGFHRHVEVAGRSLVTSMAYLLPARFAKRELAELRNGILARAETDSAIVAYLVSTDAIAHRGGREPLVEALLGVEAMVDELRGRYPGVRIDLLSDHGNDLVPTRPVELLAALKVAGFHPSGHLRRPDDVVVPRFGLVGSVAVYADPASAPRLAASLAGLEGVDLVMHEDDAGRIHVAGPAGRAVIEADAALARFRYAPESGDPLGLAPALARLRADGALDASGFAADSTWLRESEGTPYLDGLRRIVLGLRGAVRNPAAVLVSLAPGYHFGSAAATRLVQVTGTHGSLRTTSSSAFYTSTATAPPALLRSDELLPLLPAAVRAPAPPRAP